MTYAFRSFVLAVLLLFAGPVAADRWAPPGREETLSANGDYRFVVEPRALRGTSDYFREAGEGQPLPGQREGGLQRPRGNLQRRNADGQWETVWERELPNAVAPVSVLVADDGAAVVTLDNWHAVGSGPASIVIYALDGRLVRSFALIDFLPLDYVTAMPASVSSVFWRDGEGLSADGRFLELAITIPDRRFFEDGDAADDFWDQETMPTVSWRIALASGVAAPASAQSWRAALDSAAPAIELVRAEFARFAAEDAAPLPYPTEPGELSGFLHRAFERLDPDGATGHPDTAVLHARATRFRERSEQGIREALRATDKAGRPVMLAAIDDHADLADLVVAALADVPAGALGGRRIYVVVGAADRDRVAVAVERAGAQFHAIDPAVPIPPRPAGVPSEAP